MLPHTHTHTQSPFEGGTFRLELFLPEEYPMAPPKVRFMTKIYHPNIDKHGNINLETLTGGWMNNWTMSHITYVDLLMGSFSFSLSHTHIHIHIKISGAQLFESR